MATVIDRVSDDDQRQELLRYVLKLEGADLKDAKKIDTEIAALVANQVALFARVLDARTLNAFIGVASEAEAENSFNLLLTLLRKQPAATAEPQFAKIIEFLTSDTSAKQQLRLRILSNLYNFAPNRSASRLNAFISMINYAVASKSTDLILPQLKKLRPRLQDWNASKEQTRQIYSTVRKVHLELGNTPKAHKTSLKVLATYESESADNLSKVAADAAAVIVEAINLPESFQFDHILDLAAVKQLANSADHSKLHKLLTIFTTENLAAFEAFNSANTGFLESKGLSYPECRKKMQLLSLASLAAEHRELPYDRVAESLQIKPHEVEHWVISAIGAKLIDAKMDQLRRVVIVTRAAQRMFTTAQWRQLSGSLQAWRTNLQNVLKVIQSSSAKATAEGAASV